MKSKILYLKIALLWLLMLSVTSHAFGQVTWVRADNVDSYYHTTAGSLFTWNGLVRNGYCDGYGVIQWYDNGRPTEKYIGYIQAGKNEGYGTTYFADGYKSYEGNWKNDMKNGYGISYNSDGSIRFKGIFTNDFIANQYVLEAIAEKLTGLVVDQVFDGGTSIKYGLTRAVYSGTGTLEEVRIKMRFNGNINTDNYYQGTLLIDLANGKIDFVDYNDNFEFYIKLKLTTAITNQIIKTLDSN